MKKQNSESKLMGHGSGSVGRTNFTEDPEFMNMLVKVRNKVSSIKRMPFVEMIKGEYFKATAFEANPSLSVYMGMIKKYEQELVEHVLTDLLKRSPVEDDYKRLARVYDHHCEGSDYYLQMDGIILGKIQMPKYENGYRQAISFEPHKDFFETKNKS